MEYKKYLQSKDWSNKRKLKRKRHKRCAICSSENNLHTHHINYKNLTDIEQSDLRVLCDRCHKLAHKLYKEGYYSFKSNNHHSRFTIQKSAVKKYLGITHKNMFN